MPANHPNPRPAGGVLAMIALAVLLIAAAVPSVSAEMLSDAISGHTEYTTPQGAEGSRFARMNIYNVEAFKNLKSVFLRSDFVNNEGVNILIQNPYYDEPITAKIGSVTVGEGTAYYNALWSGQNVTGYQCWIEFDWFDSGTITGTRSVTITPDTGRLWNDFTLAYRGGLMSPTVDNPILFEVWKGWSASGLYVYDLEAEWYNEIIATEDGIYLNRLIGGVYYPSLLNVTDQKGIFGDSSSQNIVNLLTIPPYDWEIENPYGRIYTGSFGTTDSPSDSAQITVYIRNSQTGAILADAHIEIQDTTTDPWTEVANQTLASGQGTISLAKDSGIHLTQYRIGATVPGYQQVVPALFFRVTGPTNVVVEMDPIEGGPVNEDNAYLEFYVRDLNANGIPNANVLVDGQLRWTNAQGYTQIEVAKNASYPYSVSKSGYVTIEGTATVANGPRYVVNVVLGPGTVPTYTPGPGETPGGPGATPTPDTRTNEQKGQAIIDLIADFAEPIALLAIVATVFGLMQMMMPRRR